MWKTPTFALHYSHSGAKVRLVDKERVEHRYLAMPFPSSGHAGSGPDSGIFVSAPSAHSFTPFLIYAAGL
jgi:hypothetical protein